ncbi:hypothetical protein BO71DRAFT_413118 [Aspergillus ellipticus CBS 707.79]|uniref:Allantoin permease n=1 Tax=Aspergillus ellipticus CBS 707.79 TaxID=1448320 RepID=A0A319CXY8_9EURO|nr:hypothetical protein BO71DRAFT_413118 [Aspergillus ellipticus CBS 707.79]
MPLSSATQQVTAALSAKKARLATALQGRESFQRYLQVPGLAEDADEATVWANEGENDNLLASRAPPPPPERRNWTYTTYSFLYFGWSMDNWTLGSTMIGIGLNWWQSILVIFASQIINSVFQALNSRCGAIYHISFPLVSRAVFGMARLTLIVAAYIGSNFVANMLRAIFGHAFSDIPNHLPDSAGITTQGMIAFLVYWVIHIPIMFLRPDRMRWIFTMRMISGQLGSGLASAASGSRSQFSWFIMEAINAAMGNASPTTTNQPDFCRWSRSLWAPGIAQIILNPLAITIASTFGILATSAINTAWGLELWNQWDLLDAILTRYS